MKIQPAQFPTTGPAMAIIASRQTHLDFGSRPLRVSRSPTRETRIMVNPAPIISRNIQYVTGMFGR